MNFPEVTPKPWETTAEVLRTARMPEPLARRLVLLRHGQTEWNATDRMQGQIDTELSGVGLAQEVEPVVEFGGFQFGELLVAIAAKVAAAAATCS